MGAFAAIAATLSALAAVVTLRRTAGPEATPSPPGSPQGIEPQADPQGILRAERMRAEAVLRCPGVEPAIEFAYSQFELDSSIDVEGALEQFRINLEGICAPEPGEPETPMPLPAPEPEREQFTFFTDNATIRSGKRYGMVAKVDSLGDCETLAPVLSTIEATLTTQGWSDLFIDLEPPPPDSVPWPTKMRLRPTDTPPCNIYVTGVWKGIETVIDMNTPPMAGMSIVGFWEVND